MASKKPKLCSKKKTKLNMLNLNNKRKSFDLLKAACL
jgi:hypothetical protein